MKTIAILGVPALGLALAGCAGGTGGLKSDIASLEAKAKALYASVLAAEAANLPTICAGAADLDVGFRTYADWPGTLITADEVADEALAYRKVSDYCANPTAGNVAGAKALARLLYTKVTAAIAKAR